MLLLYDFEYDYLRKLLQEIGLKVETEKALKLWQIIIIIIIIDILYDLSTYYVPRIAVLSPLSR